MNIDYFWAGMAIVCAVLGLVAPSGWLGVVCLVLAFEYWKMAKEF